MARLYAMDGDEPGEAVRAKARRLLQLRRGVLIMLRNENFCVEQEELDMSLPQFAARFGWNPSKENLNIVTDRCAQAGLQSVYKIYVFFMEEAVVKMDSILGCLEKMDQEHVDQGMFVVPDDLSFFAQMAVTDKPRKIEIFRESRILMLADYLERMNLSAAEAADKSSTLVRQVWQQQLKPRYFCRDKDGLGGGHGVASSKGACTAGSSSEGAQLSRCIQSSTRAVGSISRGVGRIIQEHSTSA